MVSATLTELDIEWRESGPGLFTVRLPGTAKLATDCAIEVGRHTLQVRAFVCRRPDENDAGVHRWLLQRNVKLSQVSYALDNLGDIYLVARVPLAQIDDAAIDALLGTVASEADHSFNVLLELGFAESIRAEWAWRLSRGESTDNLAAFTHLKPDAAAGD